MDEKGDNPDDSQNESVASDDTEPLGDFGGAVAVKIETEPDAYNPEGTGPPEDQSPFAMSSAETDDDEDQNNLALGDNIFENYKDDPSVMKCSDCRMMFQLESKYKAHMMMHQQKRIYQCQVCSRIFSKSSNLSSHMLTHTGQKPFRCRLCLRMFPRMNNLRSHLMRMHRVDRSQTDKLTERLDPAKMAEYEKAEPDRQSREAQIALLKSEVKSELAESRLGKDSVLNSSNPGIDHLKDNADTDVVEFHGYHLKINYFTKYHPNDPEKCTVTKKTSFVCKFCSKEMTHKSNLIDHVRSHLGVKMYKCVVCRKGLSRKQNLVHHLKYVHFIEDETLDDYIEKCTTDIANSMEHVDGLGFPALESILLANTSTENKESFLNMPGSFTAEDSAIIETGETAEKSFGTSADTPEKTDTGKRESNANNTELVKVKEEKPDADGGLANIGNQSVDVSMDASELNETQSEEENEEENPEDLPYVVIEGNTPEEKLYKCKQCEFACDRKYYMKTKHVLKHTGEKPYICVICSRPYTRRYVLKNHVVAKHKLKGIELEKVIDASDLHLANDMKKLPMELGRLIDPLPHPNLDNSKPYADFDPNSKSNALASNADQKQQSKEVINEEEDFAQNFVNNVLGVNVNAGGVAGKVGDESLDMTMNEGENEGDLNEDEPDYFIKNIEKNFTFTTIPSPETKGGYIFKCDLCGLTCTRKYYMVSQHKYKHMGAKPFMCIICCKPYSRKYVLRNHLWRDHQIKGKELDTLMKATGKRVDPTIAGNNVFNRQKEVEIDLSEERESYFKAKNIHRRFFKNNDGDEGEKPKTDEIEDSVAPAGGVEESKADNSVHSQDTSLDKPGTSSGMGRRARRGRKSQKKKRKFHPFDKLIHELINYDDSSCRKCFRKFTKINNLQAHIRIQHFNLKPYNCDICHKLFTTSHNMRVHREIHFDRSKRTMSNFECQICSNIFSTKSYLKVHCMKAHKLDGKDPRVKPKDKPMDAAASSSSNVGNSGSETMGSEMENSTVYISDDDRSTSMDEAISMDETSQNAAEGEQDEVDDSDEDGEEEEDWDMELEEPDEEQSK